jgi:hypothetical protein
MQEILWDSFTSNSEVAMRQFFSRLGRFSFHLGLVVVVICVSVRVFLYYSFDEIVAHSKNASTIIIGDSHTEWGLVADSIEGAFNFSSGSERYVYNYKKLQVLSEVYPIRLVILSLSYHSFTPGEGQKQEGYDYKYCFTLYPFIREVESQVYRNLLDRSMMREVMLCHEAGLPSRNSMAVIKRVLQGYPFLITTPPVKYPSTPVGWEERIREHYNKDMPGGGLKEVDSSFVATIRDICSFCREKGYRLVLFNAPVKPMYYAHIPVAYKQLTDSVIHTLVDNRNIFYLDYSQYTLPDSCYRDSDHLNFYGANIITPLVRDSLCSMGILPNDGI